MPTAPARMLAKITTGGVAHWMRPPSFSVRPSTTPAMKSASALAPATNHRSAEASSVFGNMSNE